MATLKRCPFDRLGGTRSTKSSKSKVMNKLIDICFLSGKESSARTDSQNKSSPDLEEPRLLNLRVSI